VLAHELDHPYIDENNVAGRFVSGDLTRDELALFERHYVDCPECMDRVALAQMFRSTEAAAKPEAVVPVGIFNVLATFPARQQTLIFAAATLLLLLMPIAAMTWLSSQAQPAKPEPEPVLWLPESGPIEAHVPFDAPWVSIASSVPDAKGTYRLAIVDAGNRPIVVGPDQIVAAGTALGLRVATLPTDVSFVIVEKKSENGAYTIVSRHPLLVNWH
jgi:hypothetical protein